MPLLKLKLNLEHLQSIFNPDVILGGLITFENFKVDTTDFTVDSIAFTADQTIT